MSILGEIMKFYAKYKDLTTLKDLIDEALQYLKLPSTQEQFILFSGVLCNQPSEIKIKRDYIQLKYGNTTIYFDSYEYDDLTKTLFLYHKRELIAEVKCE